MPSLNQLFAACALLLALPLPTFLTNAYPNAVLQREEVHAVPRGIPQVQERYVAPEPTHPAENAKRHAEPQRTPPAHIYNERNAAPAPAPTPPPQLLNQRDEENCTPDDPCENVITDEPRHGRPHRTPEAKPTQDPEPPARTVKDKDGKKNDPPNKKRAAAPAATPPPAAPAIGRDDAEVERE